MVDANAAFLGAMIAAASNSWTYARMLMLVLLMGAPWLLGTSPSSKEAGCYTIHAIEAQS